MGGTGSGRKCAEFEFDRFKTLEKAWRLLDRTLEGPEIERITPKIEIAMKLCAKHVPQEIKGQFTAQVVMMGSIIKGNEVMRFNIGEGNGDADSAGNALPAGEATPDN